MKKILFVNDFADIGGAEKALIELVGGLDSSQFQSSVLLFEEGVLRRVLLERGIDVLQVFFPKEFLRLPIESKAMDAVKIIRLAFRVCLKTLGVAVLIRKRRCDLIVTNSLKALLVTWIALKVTPGRYRHFHYLHYILPEKKSIGTRCAAFLISRVDCLVCNSEATLEKARFHAVIIGKTAVIRQGFNRTTPLRQPTRDGDWVIGSAGRLNPIKNFEFIVDAVSLLKSKYPRLRLHIAGEPLTDIDHLYALKLKEYIVAIGMGDVVTFKGFAGNIWSFMDSLHVFMLCSHMEGFGRVIAEAMWSGKVVVASNVGAIPEIINSGVTGYTVDIRNPQMAADLLERLITYPEEAVAVGLKARAYAEDNLSYASYVTQWQSCLLGNATS